MKSLVHILIILFGAIIFILLLLLTFFSEPRYLSIPQFPESSTGSQIYNSGAEIAWYKNSINLYDTIYTNKEFEEITASSNTITVDIDSPGKYMSSYYDVQRKYYFDGDGYSIIQEGIGEIYIDSQTLPGRVFIYTLNTSATVTLNNEETGDIYTNIYLYPQMYVEIIPTRGKFVKGADMIRVDTVFDIGYVAGNSYQGDPVVSRYISDEDMFFHSTEQRIRALQTSSKVILEVFKDQDITLLDRYEVLDSYKTLFINIEKKKVIYKNRILKYLIMILNSEEIDETLITKIQEELQNLRHTSEEDYREMNNLIERLIYLNNSDVEISTTMSKLLLSYLIYDDLDIEKKRFLLLGFSLFTIGDIQTAFNEGIFDSFVASFSKYRRQDDTVSISGNSEYQYFSYFLERNISTLVGNIDSKVDLLFITNLLEQHINMWTISYDSSITSRISGLFIYSELLENLDVFLRQKYFNPQRDSSGLLTLQRSARYNVLQISDLSTQVQNIFEIFDRNEKFLSSSDLRDRSIKNDFIFLRKKFEEYFAALESYELYVTKYDALRQEIIKIGTINDDTPSNNKLSESSINNYLARFEGLDTSKSRVTIVDGTYYSIDNIKIYGRSFSFDIYPFDDYKLTNILIDNEAQGVQYKLTQVEEKLGSSVGDGQDISFSRFFVNTFFRQSGTTVIEDYETGPVRESEDKAIIVFKQNKLLGGEFKNILNTLPIKYNDISLVRADTSYDIFIKNTLLMLGGVRTSFSAQYFFNATDHYFSSINIIDSSGSSRIQLRISDTVEIGDIETVIIEMRSIFPKIKEISTSISKDLQADPTYYVSYVPGNKKTNIKFDLNNERYTIDVDKGGINSVYRGVSPLITTPINTNELTQYLQ